MSLDQEKIQMRGRVFGSRCFQFVAQPARTGTNLQLGFPEHTLKMNVVSGNKSFCLFVCGQRGGLEKLKSMFTLKMRTTYFFTM